MSTTPPRGQGAVARTPANEETMVLTPVPDGTDALDRIPVSRHRMWIVITSLLTALLLAAGYLIYYLWGVSREWEAQVTDVVAQNYDLGERISTSQATIVEMQRSIDLVTEQLQTAQQRILELADEVAQSGDDATFYAREINELSSLVTVASGVASAMNRCVEGQDQLVEYIRNAEDYDPAELLAYENSVDTLCANAVSANVDLQRLLAES